MIKYKINPDWPLVIATPIFGVLVISISWSLHIAIWLYEHNHPETSMYTHYPDSIVSYIISFILFCMVVYMFKIALGIERKPK